MRGCGGISKARISTSPRRRRLLSGATGERDMPFPREQTAGRVEANPAGAGQIHFAPRMQVGEVNLGAARAVERLNIGRELYQVATDEARGQTKMAKQLHHQPP